MIALKTAEIFLDVAKACVPESEIRSLPEVPPRGVPPGRPGIIKEP